MTEAGAAPAIEVTPEPKKNEHEIFEYNPSMSRHVCAAVTEFNDKLEQQVADMFETMYARRGVGLAACQVGVTLRLSVIDISCGEEPQARLVLCNPEYLATEGEQIGNEGCLSIPGYRARVKRFGKIRIKYQDIAGVVQELEAEGMLAVAIQHEIDHMDGLFYVDRISRLQRELILRKHAKKFRRAEADFKKRAREMGIKI